MKNTLILPVTVLMASVILGSFYYMSQVSKQRSIEKQQQLEFQLKQSELDAKKEASEKLEKEKRDVMFQKAACASDAEKNAVDLNKERCIRGEYCIRGENMYLVGQYDTAYNNCLERKGLK